MATTTTYTYGGSNQYVDALVRDGYKWTSPGSDTTTLTYYFQDGTPDGIGIDQYTWNSTEKTAFQRALAEWSAVANIDFRQVTTASEANFVERVGNGALLDDAYDGPGGVDDGRFAGLHDQPRATDTTNGWYNRNTSGWDETAPGTGGLTPGGRGFYTLLHEIGHGLGLDHTFDGAEMFPGASGRGDLADNNLDQGIYSVMSYNTGWSEARSGTTAYGYNTGLGAFDIAAIQTMYGARASHAGNDTYWIPDTNGPGTGFKSIWDTGGMDTIAYAGARDVTINLNPATLDNSPTGGGVVSRAVGREYALAGDDLAESIYGGYTIAADVTNFIPDVSGVTGVVIENATGGSGNDTITGNSADNILKGAGGNDWLYGGNGSDALAGGDNDDHLYGEDGIDTLLGEAGDDFLSGGDDTVRDTLKGGRGNDTYYVGVNDVVTETSADHGIDTVVTTLASYTLGTYVENLEFGGSATHSGTGNGLANTITGGSGTDSLWGMDGADTLNGGRGRDYLYGGGAHDTLNGGSGQDWLYGGAYLDALTGGADDDVFVYTNTSDSYVTYITTSGLVPVLIDVSDTITDFTRGTSPTTGDKIHLSTIDAAMGGSANDTFRFHGASDPSITDWNGVVWCEQVAATNTTIVYASTDVDSGAEFQVNLTGLHTLTASDFLL